MIKKKYRGSYQYNSQKIQELIGHKRTFFNLEFEIFEDDTLKGTVEDDISTGGMTEVGEIRGEVYEDSIFFQKQMPHYGGIDKNGNIIIQHKKKHPSLFYVGQISTGNSYTGTWEFEKMWFLWLGFIPYRRSMGNGTWEMTLIEDL